MKSETRDALKVLASQFDDRLTNIASNSQTTVENESRAFGGVMRMQKGGMVEKLTEDLVEIAWIREIGGSIARLNIVSKKIEIPIQQCYVASLTPRVRNYIDQNAPYKYMLSVDRHVFIDDEFVLGIECKAYAENAMIKRILVDFMLLKTKFPKIDTYLFQLESMLGGDYEQATVDPLGSESTHSIMSYFGDVDLKIITFMKGARKVDEPIHQASYFKPLEIDALEEAVSQLVESLNRRENH